MKIFRAYDKLAKQYIYPDSPGQQHYILNLNGEFYNLQNGSGGDEYIVEQYTGLDDKNGTKIFEGDIVKLTFDNKKAKEVLGDFIYDQFIQKKTKLIGEVKGDFDVGILSQFTYFVDGFISFGRFKVLIKTVEVIGNINENSKLLKS